MSSVPEELCASRTLCSDMSGFVGLSDIGGQKETLLTAYLQILKRSHLAATCVITTSLEGAYVSYRLRIKFADHSSDLLIRHERLTHNKDGSSKNQRQDRNGANEQESSQSTGKRRRGFENSIENDDDHESPRMSNPMNFRGMSSPANPPILDGPSNPSQNDEYSLAALSMAAEYSALQGDFTAASPFQAQNIPQAPNVALRNDQMATPVDSLQGPYANQSQGLGFEDSLDSLAAFLDNDLLSSYHFSSLISTEQPMVYFSPESWANANDFMPRSTVQAGASCNSRTTINLKNPILSRASGRDYPLCNQRNVPRRLNSRNQSIVHSRSLSSDDRHNVIAKLAEFRLCGTV
jgi:hypothetical protein